MHSLWNLWFASLLHQQLWDRKSKKLSQYMCKLWTTMTWETIEQNRCNQITKRWLFLWQQWMQTGKEEEASKSSGPQNQSRKKTHHQKPHETRTLNLTGWLQDPKPAVSIYQLSSLIDEEKSTQFVLFYKEEPQDCKRIFLQARWWHMGLTNLFSSCLA